MRLHQIRKLAVREAQRRLSADADPLDIAELAVEIIDEWRAEAAHDREQFGEVEDTPCFENGRDNCNDWGTGEGQFHGRM